MKIAVWINDVWGTAYGDAYYPHTPSSVVAYHRLDLPHSYLGSECEVEVKVEANIPEFVEADIFVAHRMWSPSHLKLIHKLQAQGIMVVCDVDDDLFSVSGVTARGWYTDEKKAMIAKLLAAVDAITCTNATLADELRAYNDTVEIFPNCIDLREFKINAFRTASIHIGWTGGDTHEEDLELLLPVINTIANKYRGVGFTLFGGKNIKKFSAKHIPGVAFDEYYSKLEEQHFDIMLAPLKDTKFNRSKSDLRLREAAAMGIPVIASPVGEYKNLGKEGILAGSSYEWIQAIRHLISDARLRREIGEKARARAEQEYDINVQTDHRMKFYQQLLTKLPMKALA